MKEEGRRRKKVEGRGSGSEKKEDERKKQGQERGKRRKGEKYGLLFLQMFQKNGRTSLGFCF